MDPKILGRVRGLLAKAESTQFPEEAEALSAKAQELMTRHAFERALLDAKTHVSQAAASRRIWLDAPYVGAKAQLVNAVADANRCKGVVYEKLGFVAVLGDELDLDITELLSTSLLVQATRALVATDRDSGRTGQVRNYRQSFLLAYATRIGQRLARGERARRGRRPAAAGAGGPEQGGRGAVRGDVSAHGQQVLRGAQRGRLGRGHVGRGSGRSRAGPDGAALQRG